MGKSKSKSAVVNLTAKQLEILLGELPVRQLTTKNISIPNLNTISNPFESFCKLNGSDSKVIVKRKNLNTSSKLKSEVHHGTSI